MNVRVPKAYEDLKTAEVAMSSRLLNTLHQFDRQ